MHPTSCSVLISTLSSKDFKAIVVVTGRNNYIIDIPVIEIFAMCDFGREIGLFRSLKKMKVLPIHLF